MDRILIAIDDHRDAVQVMPKAELIASSVPARQVNAVRIVYEGLADLDSKHVAGLPDLKRFIIEAEETALKEVVESTCELDVECVTLWNKNKWQGILHAQERCSASLIVKQVSASSKFVNLRTPYDWNLLRHTTVPVLLSHAPWKVRRAVFAAIDVYDQAHGELNLRVLRQARQLASVMDAQLHIYTVVPNVNVWVEQAYLPENYERIAHEIEDEATQYIIDLCKQCAVDNYEVHVRPGVVEVELQSVANQASVLVIGTKSRTGVAGAVLGNTAEKILHRVATDVLAVP